MSATARRVRCYTTWLSPSWEYRIHAPGAERFEVVDRETLERIVVPVRVVDMPAVIGDHVAAKRLLTLNHPARRDERVVEPLLQLFLAQRVPAPVSAGSIHRHRENFDRSGGEAMPVEHVDELLNMVAANNVSPFVARQHAAIVPDLSDKVRDGHVQHHRGGRHTTLPLLRFLLKFHSQSTSGCEVSSASRSSSSSRASMSGILPHDSFQYSFQLAGLNSLSYSA